MSSDVRWHISGTSWDQCRSMVQHSFTATETRRLVRMDSPGRPPQLSHSSWTMSMNMTMHKSPVATEIVNGLCLFSDQFKDPLFWQQCNAYLYMMSKTKNWLNTDNSSGCSRCQWPLTPARSSFTFPLPLLVLLYKLNVLIHESNFSWIIYTVQWHIGWSWSVNYKCSFSHQ